MFLLHPPRTWYRPLRRQLQPTDTRRRDCASAVCGGQHDCGLSENVTVGEWWWQCAASFPPQQYCSAGPRCPRHDGGGCPACLQGIQEKGKGDAYRSARRCGPAASGRLSEEEEGSGRQWRDPKGRSAGCQRERRDSNSLHVRLRASSTRPDSPPWRVDEVAVLDSGAAVVSAAAFLPESDLESCPRNWGRMHFDAVSCRQYRETRELLAAPCGTIIHELLGAPSPGNESPRAPGRLCPRPHRTEAARRVPWMRAGQTDTHQEKVGGCSKHQLVQADAA